MALQEEHARAGVIQDISKLLRSKPNVQRQQNGSRFDDTVISFEQAMAVGAQKGDRKSTRLNSSHGYISYAVFCLKKKNINHYTAITKTLSPSVLSHVISPRLGGPELV